MRPQYSSVQSPIGRDDLRNDCDLLSNAFQFSSDVGQSWTRLHGFDERRIFFEPKSCLDFIFGIVLIAVPFLMSGGGLEPGLQEPSSSSPRSSTPICSDQREELLQIAKFIMVERDIDDYRE
jgi:hypothetical protein